MTTGTAVTGHPVHLLAGQPAMGNNQSSPTPTPTPTVNGSPIPDKSSVERPNINIPENIRCSELPGAIIEEEEESASEPLEPITPTSDIHTSALHQPHVVTSDPTSHVEQLHKPIIVNTEATPPPTPPNPTPSASRSSAAPPRASPLRSASKSLKSLFRRSSSHYPDEVTNQPSNPTPPEKTRALKINVLQNGRKDSVSSTAQNSPELSLSNSPDSPSSPASTIHSGNNNAFLSVSSPDNTFEPKRPNRSSTGLSLRNRSRVMFGSTPKPQREDERRIRSPSLGDVQNQGERPGFSIPAVSGAGLKARRMSASLPDDFYVDTCALSEEYVSASKVPGKRGKEIGKGATATVKIMYRKGLEKSTHFAVKEFRKRGQKETENEYEQKVKSEFSIANSLHHPNIVETFRLCTHSGRWNHVMEYCSYGELFTLVQKNYLQPRDNLCFFKQVLRGVAHLHDNGIAHRDIKLENLLLSDEGFVKITDFGVSEVFSGIHPGLRSAGGECGKEMGELRLSSPGICGSLPYIAPEVLAKKGIVLSCLVCVFLCKGILSLHIAYMIHRYNLESYDPRPLDIWSCAIVYLTLHFRGNIWPAAEKKHLNYAKFSDGWTRWLSNNPDREICEEEKLPSCGAAFKLLNNSSLKRLLLRMLHPEPAKRITIHDILADRYFKIIECCSPDPSRDRSKIVQSIDAAGKGSCRMANKMVVQKIHHHFPPEKKYLPQHRFDMGTGYS
ncbi:hypothetical protein FQN57_003903 [Myotisia sp. PD_48]|nr:hypothetical protein FQN57_003903 [Myotisia sp. PD_48]